MRGMGSEPGFRGVLALLLLASFAINLGVSAVAPVFPYLVLAFKGVLKALPELTAGPIEAHRGALELGALMAAFMAARAPAAAAAGALSDLFGRRRAILAGMGLYLASSIGLLLAADIPSLIAFRGLQGGASGIVWPVAEAYLADSTPRWRRGRAISAYTSSMLLAEILGPAIGVGFYKLWTSLYGPADLLTALKSPIILLAAASAASLLSLTRLPRGGGAGGRGLRPILEGLKRLGPKTSRSLKAIYLNGAINGLALGIMMTSAVVYLIEEVVKDPAYLGTFFAVFPAAALPAIALSGVLSDRLRRRKPVALAGYLVGRAPFFLIPLTRDFPTLLLLMALMSLVFGLSMPAMRALQADLAPRELRGTIFGAQQLLFNGGVLAGALLGGWLAQTAAQTRVAIAGASLTGYITPFWTAGALGATTTAIFALYVEEP